MSGTGADGLPEHRLVIGMEVHVQLKTRTKCFCACAVLFGEAPNTNVCPVCLGLPGALPVLNRAALRQAVRGGLGLGCEIAAFTKWDRKNYFYPDLPKGYQITQFDRPLCRGGAVEIDGDEGPQRVRLERAHLEEDTGKLTHLPGGDALVDYNRCGTPLLEIVSHPDLSSAADAGRYLEELRRLLEYLDVSDCDMEKGQMRCEPNVNVEVREGGEWVPTRIVELKNLNSIAAVRHAIEFERVRQVRALLDDGERGPRPRSTRGWDDDARRTFLQRTKEEAADYRYFPEPDLPPVTVAAALAGAMRDELPELPRPRRLRFVEELGLSDPDALALTASRGLADWYEAVAAAAGDARAAANWVRTDVLREMHARGLSPDGFPVAPEELGRLIAAVAGGTLPHEAAKSEVFPAMVETGATWKEIVAERGLGVMDDADVDEVVAAVVAEHADVVETVRGGKLQALDVLVGEVMKRTRGTAPPERVRELLERLTAGPE